MIRLNLRYFVGLCLLAIFTRAAGAQAVSQAELETLEERAIREATALVDPSVVQIVTVGGLDRVGNVLTSTGPTTGVVVSRDGYVITSSFNFISRPSSVLVSVGGRRQPARIVATDQVKQLTLLKIEADDLTPARPTPKKELRVGQWAIAVGRTYDVPAPSVSLGIISQLNRIWGKAIQTDCKVSPTNYGGPLVDIQGRVAGILVPLSPTGKGETAGVEWYDSGIGFAIPLEDIYASLDRMKQGEDLKPGLLGITFRGRDIYGIKPILDRVRFGSPAQKAGFEPGDEIVEVDGHKTVRQAQVRHAIGGKYAGDTIRVTVKRGEKTIAGELELVAELLPYESAFLGILPTREGRESDESRPGVGVRYVYDESPAAGVGIKVFDRITSFNGTATNSAAELVDLVSRELPDSEATLGIERDGKQQTVKLKLAAIPTTVPEELRSSLIPLPENDAVADDNQPDAENGADAPRTGRFSDRIEGQEQSYWAYVPETYNPEHNYGLLVWIHPNGDTMEAAMFDAWKLICDQRGVILLAPKAANISGWKPDEAEPVKAMVDEFRETYSIDSQRVFLHSYSLGGPFAYHLAFKYREDFRGLCTVAAPLRVRPPENQPDFRLQFHLICGDKDDVLKLVKGTVGGLRAMKFPVSYRELPDHSHKYPEGNAIEETARWADSLDRI